jgi:hypothetical protein
VSAEKQTNVSGNQLQLNLYIIHDLGEIKPFTGEYINQLGQQTWSACYKNDL